MSGEGGAGTQDVSEHPGEPAASLPESFPLSPSAPLPHLYPGLPLSSSLSPGSISQVCVTLLGFFRGLPDPTRLQAPQWRVPSRTHVKSSEPGTEQRLGGGGREALQSSHLAA